MQIIREIGSFLVAHRETIIAILIVVLGLLGTRYPAYKAVLTETGKILGGIAVLAPGGLNLNMPAAYQAIAQKTPLTILQAQKYITTNDSGGVSINKIGIAKAVVNSGDFKKLERKFRKFIKKI